MNDEMGERNGTENRKVGTKHKRDKRHRMGEMADETVVERSARRRREKVARFLYCLVHIIPYRG
jgi:hypothetical protein